MAVIHGLPVPYAVTWDLPVAGLPGRLVTALTPLPPPPPAADPPPRLPATSKRVTAYVRAAVAAEYRNVATEGHRHITVYAAAALGELHGNGWISATAITYHHLTDTARHHLGVAEVDWHELITTIHDGIAAGREHPRALADRPSLCDIPRTPAITKRFILRRSRFHQTFSLTTRHAGLIDRLD
jgi:hypothetical protein